MTEKQFNDSHKDGAVTAGIGFVSYDEPGLSAHVTLDRMDKASMASVWDRLSAEVERIKAAA